MFGQRPVGDAHDVGACSWVWQTVETSGEHPWIVEKHLQRS
jgi:hypothetical protein